MDKAAPLTHGSLFTGIGGFDLGFEWAGFTTAWQVERSAYCRDVLERRFPGVPRYAEIADCGARNLAPVDVLTGGFPCQPCSLAGKRRGASDDRWLWPQMRRIISALKPAWVVAENVYGLVALQDGMVFESVLRDLEAEGYDVQPLVIPACAVDAPHRRERVWILAHAPQQRRQRRPVGPGSAEPQGPYARAARLRRWAPEPRVGRVAYGVPHRVDRLTCLGNAAVPQVAYRIARGICEAIEGISGSP